ncbi:MAG TPA: hypothetical protein VJI46_07760 [Candidatus Nanoarchaeia archaeon]|nr:hypothetical protein [Candidatus Nanoarchaeia archaeon]
MDNREKIIAAIKLNGPVIPMQIAKVISSDSIVASAHLSELVSAKMVRISHVKHGSSPLYYLSGQEPMLQNFASNLHEKEKKTYDLLKEQHVLRDVVQDPLVRVTLREIKDFAIPVQVNYESKSELFWKWYLLPNEEAEKRIKGILGKVEAKKEEKQTVLEPKKGEIKVEEKKKEIQERKQKEEVESKEEKREEKKEKIEEKREVKKDESFSYVLEGFISENKIEIMEKNVIKKDSEIEMVVRLPSSVGNLLYFCKAKNKKKISDGDLSSAYIQSQSRKMPILFLTTGELTKKAKEMLEHEFKSMTLKKI